jgi:flagellar basal-body rod modification protein FlgD
MQVSSVSSALDTTSTAGSTTPSSSTTPAPTQTLGVNDFMKLLATQFEEQDPLKPMDDTAFIAQTAQFTALQQTTTLTQQVTQLAASQDLATANGYIGRQLTVTTGTNGQTATGTVSSVDTSGSAPQLNINGVLYPLSAVTQVAPATPTPATAGGS